MSLKLFFSLLLIGLAYSHSEKIAPQLKASLQSNGKASVVITFTNPTAPVFDRVDSLRFNHRSEKITFLKAELEQLREETQSRAISLLNAAKLTSSGLEYRSLWVNNRLFIRNVDLHVLEIISHLPEVEHIREQYKLDLKQPAKIVPNSKFAEWGIEKIEAQEAWALPGGNNGQGVVVAIIDTGVRRTHEALRNNYREEYGWFHPYDANSTVPYDDWGHGTHCTGTVLGSGGIGVAPGAQWIACQACDMNCDEESFSLCGQWQACPTLPNGQGANCSMAPDISSNSWGINHADDWYDDILRAWLAAGTIPIAAVHNYGNGGRSCSSTTSPGDRPLCIGVGSTTVADVLSDFSSRGPANNTRKPEISAPGSNVRSAYNSADDAYAEMSGTSMATPHTAGLAALLLSHNPNLTFQQITNLLEQNADQDLGLLSDSCGGIPSDQFPNNAYGFGRINARKSLQAAINGTIY